MGAELIVVNGPKAGTRYDLTRGDLFIGRSPDLKLVLAEPEVGWRHCQIRQQGSRFLIVDLRTSGGTYVNGIRSAERWLENRDQIGIGKTILMFRSGHADDDDVVVPAAETKPVLLTACSLVFLFRALAASVSEAQTTLLQNQILRLVADLIPGANGCILLGASCPELLAAYESRVEPKQEAFRSALPRGCVEGGVEDFESRILGGALYLAG